MQWLNLIADSLIHNLTELKSKDDSANDVIDPLDEIRQVNISHVIFYNMDKMLAPHSLNGGNP